VVRPDFGRRRVEGGVNTQPPKRAAARRNGVAVGSYGILYILDEDVSYDWQRWVMRRGHLTLGKDDSLSPHIGKVEDADA
jgi:hypothetical protein